MTQFTLTRAVAFTLLCSLFSSALPLVPITIEGIEEKVSTLEHLALTPEERRVAFAEVTTALKELVESADLEATAVEKAWLKEQLDTIVKLQKKMEGKGVLARIGGALTSKKAIAVYAFLVLLVWLKNRKQLLVTSVHRNTGQYQAAPSAYPAECGGQNNNDNNYNNLSQVAPPSHSQEREGPSAVESIFRRSFPHQMNTIDNW